MLYFRDYQWLLVNGHSRFTAYISSNTRTREAVRWSLDLRWVATGADWRRVAAHDRPSLWLNISSMQAPALSWQGLKALSFWEYPRQGMASAYRTRGYLDFLFSPRRDGEKEESITGIGDHIWRVAARDGHWFVVELGLLTDLAAARQENQAEELVTTAGEEAPEERPADWWKADAVVYAIESVPFGTVTVRAPRNARDVETYALARAQELIGGLSEPEHVEISDHSKWEKSSPQLQEDIFVQLHFFGQYQP